MSEDGHKALGEVRGEEKLLPQLANDLARLAQQQRDVLAKASQELLTDATRVERVIRAGAAEHEHTIGSWTGDLAHERTARGGQLPPHFQEHFDRLLSLEKRGKELRETIERELAQLTSVVSALPSQQPLPPDVDKLLHAQAALLLKQEQQWAELDKQRETELLAVDATTMQNDVISAVLQNYKTASLFLGDLVHGKGMFAGKSDDERRDVLKRILEAKGQPFWARELLGNSALATAVNQFMNARNPAATKYPWLLQPLSAVQRGSISRIEHDSALQAIQNGSASYSYPQEYFETYAYAEETQDSEYVQFVSEAWDHWEWTNFAFEWDGGRKLTILWYMRGSSQVIKIPVDDYDWKSENCLSENMPSQIKMLWGAAWSRAVGKGYLFLRKGVLPVARGGNNPVTNSYVWTLHGYVIKNNAVPRRVGLPARKP